MPRIPWQVFGADGRTSNRRFVVRLKKRLYSAAKIALRLPFTSPLPSLPLFTHPRRVSDPESLSINLFWNRRVAVPEGSGDNGCVDNGSNGCCILFQRGSHAQPTRPARQFSLCRDRLRCEDLLFARRSPTGGLSRPGCSGCSPG